MLLLLLLLSGISGPLLHLGTRDNFRHSGPFLSFNEVYDIIVHLATQ